MDAIHYGGETKDRVEKLCESCNYRPLLIGDAILNACGYDTVNKCIKQEQKYVNVDDNWCPNYEGNKILVTIELYTDYVRFHAWGMDDLGVEMYCPDGGEEVYDTWKEHIYDKMPSVVNMDWFLQHGFYPA